MRLFWQRKKDEPVKNTKEKGISEEDAFNDGIMRYLRDFSDTDKKELLTGFVFECVDVISDRVASLPLNHRVNGEITDWDMYNILQQETPIGGLYEKIKYAVMSYLAEGRAVFYAPRVGGVITGFYNIPASYLRTQEYKGFNKLLYRSPNYKVVVDGLEYTIPAEDISGLRNPNMFGRGGDR